MLDDDGNGRMIWVDPARIRFQHSKIRPVFSGCGRSVVGTLDEIRQGSLHPSDLPPIIVILGRRNVDNDHDHDDDCDDHDDDDPEDELQSERSTKGRKNRDKGRHNRQKKQKPNRLANNDDTVDDSNNVEYFSLNNRRLWVLKRCREEGLLANTNHKIQVRVREPKSKAERERYSVKNCVLEAKIVPEKQQQQHRTHDQQSVSHENHHDNKEGIAKKERKSDEYSDEDEKTTSHNNRKSDDESGGESDDDDDFVPSNRFSALVL
jgi:hypothetical protein